MPLSHDRLKDLRQQRAKAIADARKLHDEAQARAEGQRELTAEERASYTRATDEARQIGETIRREEELAAAEAELSEPEGRSAPARQPGNAEDVPEEVRDRVASRGWLPREYRNITFGDVPEARRRDGYLHDAPAATVGDLRTLAHYMRSHPEVIRGMSAEERRAYNDEGQQLRAMQHDVDASGGYLALPPQVIAGLLQAADSETFIRSRSTVIVTPGAQGLGVVSLDEDADDAEWTAELKTGGETDIGLGGRELRPTGISKRTKLSMKLLRTAPGIERILLGRLGHKFGVTMEKAGLTGTGAGQPLGLFTASAHGIPTSRDIATGNTATAVTPEGWIRARRNIKPKYRRNAVAIVSPELVTQAMLWKDGTGRFMLQDSLQVGEPDRISSVPVLESDFAPSTFTSGQYVAVIGDLNYYWWNDSLTYGVQRLNELYAETNQVGFIARGESDGMPVLGEAFTRVKLG